MARRKNCSVTWLVVVVAVCWARTCFVVSVASEAELILERSVDATSAPPTESPLPMPREVGLLLSASDKVRRGAETVRETFLRGALPRNVTAASRTLEGGETQAVGTAEAAGSGGRSGTEEAKAATTEKVEAAEEVKAAENRSGKTLEETERSGTTQGDWPSKREKAAIQVKDMLFLVGAQKEEFSKLLSSESRSEGEVAQEGSDAAATGKTAEVNDSVDTVRTSEDRKEKAEQLPSSSLVMKTELIPGDKERPKGVEETESKDTAAEITVTRRRLQLSDDARKGEGLPAKEEEGASTTAKATVRSFSVRPPGLISLNPLAMLSSGPIVLQMKPYPQLKAYEYWKKQKKSSTSTSSSTETDSNGDNDDDSDSRRQKTDNSTSLVATEDNGNTKAERVSSIKNKGSSDEGAVVVTSTGSSSGTGSSGTARNTGVVVQDSRSRRGSGGATAVVPDNPRSATNCFECGDYFGYDVKKIQAVATVNDCQRRCQAEPLCEFFTWSERWGSCYLKHSRLEFIVENSRRVVSGPKYCHNNTGTMVCREMVIEW